MANALKEGNSDEMTRKMILSYTEISLAIQKTKHKDKALIRQGREDLQAQLTTVLATWGTHPIAMEVEKSLADVHLKEGSTEGCLEAEKHYDAACKMMNELDITQVCFEGQSGWGITADCIVC